MSQKVKNNPSGKTVKCPEGYYAFVPNPLPPPIIWTDNLVRSLSEAESLIAKLSQEGQSLANPLLFIRPFIRREAVLSSRIEGTQTTLVESFQEELQIKPETLDNIEVNNYIKALEYGIKRLQKLPLSIRLICEVHEKLMKGVRGNFATPGELRRSQNWIGIPGCNLHNASYIPPPPNLVMQCLGDLEKFIHESACPPLITIGLVHQQFEAIHPFLDGNGRVGRLLIILYLIEKKIIPSPILYISAFLESTRTDYYARLGAVNSKGDWNGWLEYFLNGVATQSKDVLIRINKIKALIDSWKSKFSGKSNYTCQLIIDGLIGNPFITTNSIIKKHKLTFPRAQRAIDKLLEGGVIIQNDNSKRNKVYCSKKILRILDEATKL